MTMLKRRPGDDTRQRADAKLRVHEYVQSKPLDAVFSIATASGGSGVPFNTVASQLDALVAKGVLVEVQKHRRCASALQADGAVMTEPTVELGSSRRAKQNSGRTTYCTPREILACLAKLGRIGFDPCWHPTSLVRARLTFTKEQNGLRDWPTNMLGFVNWPYGAQESPVWSNHCIAQARRGVELVTLFPASTETSVYRTQLFSCSAMVHVERRLTFVGETDPAMFGSALSYFGPRPTAFVEAFRSIAYPISSPLNRPVWRAAA